MNGTSVKVYSKAQNGTTKLSTNFKVSEFACKDGSDTVFVAPTLVIVLQKIRDYFGKAIVITSGYRTETHNKSVGGATYSQHKYGMAADISVSGVDPLTVARYAQSIMAAGGVGLYQNFVHVDVRDNKARWDSRSGKQVAVQSF